MKKMTLLQKGQTFIRECGKGGKTATKPCYQKQLETVITKNITSNHAIKKSYNQTAQEIDDKRTIGENLSLIHI